jgi:hypothetical protein
VGLRRTLLWLLPMSLPVIFLVAVLVWSSFQPRIIMDEWVGIVEDKRLGRVIEGEQIYWLTITRADEKRIETQVPASTYNAVKIGWTIVRVRQVKAGILDPWYEVEIIE